MEGPKRGEIWRVRIEDPTTGRARYGSEMRGNEKGERFCLIVSHDDYNQLSHRLTVVPLTGYTNIKEDLRRLWTACE